MKGRVRLAAGVGVIAAVTVAATVAVAGGGDSIREELSGYEEDPLVLLDHRKRLVQGPDRREATGDRLPAQLRRRSRADVTQAHIHFGGQRAERRHQRLPLHQSRQRAGRDADLSGRARHASAAPSGRPTSSVRRSRGSLAGEFAELVDAIRAGVTYVNVHSTLYPRGEIRAQLEDDRDARRLATDALAILPRHRGAEVSLRRAAGPVRRADAARGRGPAPGRGADPRRFLARALRPAPRGPARRRPRRPAAGPHGTSSTGASAGAAAAAGRRRSRTWPPGLTCSAGSRSRSTWRA